MLDFIEVAQSKIRFGVELGGVPPVAGQNPSSRQHLFYGAYFVSGDALAAQGR